MDGRSHGFLAPATVFALTFGAFPLNASGSPGKTLPARTAASASALTAPLIANQGQVDQAIKFQTPFLAGEARVTTWSKIIHAVPNLTLTEQVVGGSSPRRAAATFNGNVS